jgi:hypothetical protein
VSVPGISDLDRIAVVADRARVPSVWQQLSPSSRQLAMHAPFLVDVATFRRHRWFAYIEPLDLSFGEPVQLEDRPLPSYSEPLLAAESIVVSLLSTVKQASTGLVKVRPTLCQLNNLRHALALARMSDEEAPAARQLAADVTELRSTWFASPERERAQLAREVAARAVPVLFETIWLLGERSGQGRNEPAEIRLGPPWSNVTLVSSKTDRNQLSGTPRLRVPRLRSARLAEIAWRTARPRIAVHPVVLALLAGTGDRRDVADFRSSRDELVRGYRNWLAKGGRGYSEIGLASAFLSSNSPSRRTTT